MEIEIEGNCMKENCISPAFAGFSINAGVFEIHVHFCKLHCEELLNDLDSFIPSLPEETKLGIIKHLGSLGIYKK